jgi:MFS family permease
VQRELRPSGGLRSLSSAIRHPTFTPAVIVLCGCLISMIGFGPRSALGFFLTPLSQAHGWGREVFALSVAMQTLLYGAAQPFSGAIADRFGTVRVIIAGTLLYAAGLFMMAHAATPGMLYLSSGVLIGFGLSGCSFNLVISSFGKLLPESWRSLAFGAGTAAGSFGQFLFSPLGVSLIDAFGWQRALEIFAALLLLMIPLAFAISTPRSDAPQTSAPAPPTNASSQTPPRILAGLSGAMPTQTYRQALAEALGHRSYILLVLGFFTCGFQLGFVPCTCPPT